MKNVIPACTPRVQGESCLKQLRSVLPPSGDKRRDDAQIDAH